MKYTANDLVKELYDSNPSYHIYTLEEFTEICLMPLAFFRKKMKEPVLPSMRFKHMGIFIVYPHVIAKLLHYNQRRYDKGIIAQDTYEEFRNQMEEVHRQLTSETYQRGKVNIIYNDEESTPQTSTG